MKKLISNLATELSQRYEWVDDLLDIVWRGRCYHLRYRSNRTDRASVSRICHQWDQLGPWTVSLDTVGVDRAPIGTCIVVVYRGKSLLRWSRDISIEQWELNRTELDRTWYRLWARTYQLWPESGPLIRV